MGGPAPRRAARDEPELRPSPRVPAGAGHAFCRPADYTGVPSGDGPRPMRLAPLLLTAVILPLAACSKPVPEEPTKPAEPTVAAAEPAPAPKAQCAPSRDPNSYAETDKVCITHIALDLGVDFAKKVLAGSATLDLDWKDPAARTLVLDTRALTIEKVEGFDGSAWQALTHTLADADA